MVVLWENNMQSISMKLIASEAKPRRLLHFILMLSILFSHNTIPPNILIMLEWVIKTWKRQKCLLASAWVQAPPIEVEVPCIEYLNFVSILKNSGLWSYKYIANHLRVSKIMCNLKTVLDSWAEKNIYFLLNNRTEHPVKIITFQ